MIVYFMNFKEKRIKKLVLKDSLKNITKINFDFTGKKAVILSQNKQNKDVVIILSIE